jgi:hypothetical protein
LAAVRSSAQLYGSYDMLGGGTTNYLTAISTNTYAALLVLKEFTQFPVQVSWAYTSGTNGNNWVQVRFYQSLDGVTFENVPSLVVNANNTNYVTNFFVGSVGFVRANIENTNNIGLTNVHLVVAVKPIRGSAF